MTARNALWISAALVACLLLARVWLAQSLPLTDTTEARYGEIARKMVETSDWITPQHDYGVPYLAKPPLAFWLAALGIEIGAATDIAPRAPILALTVVFCVFFFVWLRALFGILAATAALLMMSSSLLFFVSAGAVMTDMVLTVFVSTGLMAFWQRLRGGSPWLEVVLYVALALGLLTKGPLAAVLVLVPIAVWSVSTGRLSSVWRRFAWLRGAALTLALTLPWYVAAEWRSPGFLAYFIVGEHFGRFLIPGWSGDLYGRAHDVPLGTIWIFLSVSLLPWTLAFVPAATQSRSTLAANARRHRELVLFTLAWGLVPMLLFTAAANIIVPYALPAMPAVIVLAVALLCGSEEADLRLVKWSWLGPASMLALVALFAIRPGLAGAHTQKALIASIRAHNSDVGVPIYYWRERRFSAEYYGRGRVSTIDDWRVVDTALDRADPFVLVVAQDQLVSLPAGARDRLERIEATEAWTVFEPGHGMNRPAGGPSTVQASSSPP